ncbi:MAG: MBL fold metallo-hydrolase, partial [Bradymonadaceae bacterium]
MERSVDLQIVEDAMGNQHGELIVESFLVGPIQTNIYLIGPADGEDAAIVDGGGDVDGLIGSAEEHDWTITRILQTHAHVDHVGGLNELVQRIDASIYLHPDERQVYDAAPQQGRMFGIDIDPLPDVDQYLEDGDRLEIAGATMEVLHLPGHSPGGIGFYFADAGVLFGGDVLFEGSIGRVDLPGADPDAMELSLERLAELPDSTTVYPGHGPATTIGRETTHNP